MDGELAQAVLFDIIRGVPESESKYAYDTEAREFRRRVEQSWSEYEAEHPDAILHVPDELQVGDAPDVPAPVDDSVD